MEPARSQLARPLPPLERNGGTLHPSVHTDRVALGYMGHWVSFVQDVMAMFHAAAITHQVPVHNESENYVVGSELGLSGRFVRNLCDPVIEALIPLPEMSSTRFADIQALTVHGTVIPDVAFGLVAQPEPLDSLARISMVGEFKTPWTVGLHQMDITRPNPDLRLENLIGQVASQMRMAEVKYAFLTTYNVTVFVQRVNDFSYLLSRPMAFDCQGPSLREMFVGFCLLSRIDPNYHESGPDVATRLRGIPGPRTSERLWVLRPQDLPPPSTPPTITSTSVIVECGTTTPVIVNCMEQMSLRDTQGKSVWLAEINGVRCVLKCWVPDMDELFETEAAVYQRLESSDSSASYLFAKCIARGKVMCSSLFPTGWVVILEHRAGERLSDIWSVLSAAERAHIEEECLKAIRALRAISIRLDDPGQHNVLYSRETRAVTLVDFEVAVPVATNTLIPTSYEMRRIFSSSLITGGEGG
ncbi:hypothetical protein N7457_006966 [Penicillium paradoxum]|uniref:uncharacterized protein n=1 Tax=Penicillium paradoxum TaxID=176176 RepID=UPI00254900ED|nr:uncharacterized protein N7457_006966 [Penicillium paradoxum]KAJ5779246.1 hypothetical protein N7457_006966 [Penicillium paradoxum]